MQEPSHARFREENLEKTPLAITAFSGENMEARNLSDVTMIDTFSPNTIIRFSALVFAPNRRVGARVRTMVGRIWCERRPRAAHFRTFSTGTALANSLTRALKAERAPIGNEADPLVFRDAAETRGNATLLFFGGSLRDTTV